MTREQGAERDEQVTWRDVVAAALEVDGRILIGRRPPGTNVAGRWEFPGGKVERGESHEAALRRELREELGVDVRVGELLAATEHRYPHLGVRLFLYACSLAAGEARALYHSEIAWAPPARLDEYEVAESNRPFVDRLRRP